MGEINCGRDLCIGFIVNPIAGAGGPAGHKGSDLEKTRIGIEQGNIQRRSQERAHQFLSLLGGEVSFVSAPGEMGEEILRAYPHFNVEVISYDYPESSSAEDTRNIVTLFCERGVDLIVFIGGDGTARDVCSVNSGGIPVLGVPSGVKMHSGVFAIDPRAAASVLSDILSGQLVSLSEQEVRDIDEAALQKSQVKSRYYGSQWVPDDLRYIQSVKSGGVEVDELVLADIAAEVIERLEESQYQGALIIFAGGSTTQFVQQEMGCEGTLLGVDVVKNGALVAEDVSADTLERLLEEHDGPSVIVLTAIGGQGHILGRGNQQLSPAVLKKVGRDHLWVVMTKTKLEALNQRPLLIDSNDKDIDSQWQGLIPVITGYRDQVLYRVGVEDGR